ncbi:MAG: MFS transporter, partial [Pseudomonadota bacterium]|nr:MFS transporter [Pseudomonadota bacterium]
VNSVAMANWGWRVPFLAAAPMGLVGVYIRSKLEESPVFQVATHDPHPEHIGVRVTLRRQWKSMVRLGGFISLTAVSFNTFSTYMTTFFRMVVGMHSDTVFLSNFIALVSATAMAPIIGRICDRIGRRPTMVAASLCLGGLAVPAYLVAGIGTLGAAVAAQLLLAVGAVTANVVTAVLLSELFPTTERYTASAITYNIAYAVFGGTAPLVATLLITTTGNYLMPAVYIAVIAAVALVAALTLPETSRRPLLATGAVS